MVEHFRLSTLSRWDEVLVENFQDVFANLGKLCFDLLAIFFDQANLSFVALGLFLLLDGSYNSPRSTTGTNNVLVRD